MAIPTRAEIRATFEALRDAVRELVETDPERALLYLRSATCSVESWTRSLRARRLGPSKLDPGPERRQ